MSAYVEHKFKRGFILNEENLRKIHEIIIKRFNEIDDSLKPQYEILRSDSYAYITNDFKDIINEDNSAYNRILKITIFEKIDEVFYFELSFSQDDGTYIFIKGEDRDLVYLLLSDLRTYLNNDVNKRIIVDNRSVKNIIYYTQMLMSAVAFLLLFFNISSKASCAISFESAIKTQNLQEKLNYLVYQSYAKDYSNVNTYLTTFVMIFLIFIFASLFLNKLIQRVVIYFYPFNVFLFGKKNIEYEKTTEIKSKILWTIIVGLIISLVAGFIVFF